MVRCFRKIDPDRRLRIGYVSPDFRSHAVCSFSMPLISSHNRQEFEIYLYANVEDPDAITQEFRQQADAWRDIFGMPNDQAAQLIRDDQIDILIDLAGHTSGNRLLVFAQKPAPIQVTYLGYPATTGMETIDYRLTDAHADPPGLTDAFCTEKLVRLPQTTWCFKARLRSSDVSPLPAISNGYVTFGSFNNFSKTNEPLYDLWAKVLHAVPNSRLLFKARPFSSQAVLSRVAARFDQLGVARDRVDLRRWVPLPDHLAAYNSVDIALDSFPYHGTTTTCEAMWMGVPTITLAGDSHLSRVGLSLMTNAGLGQFVAQNKREYVEIAANLAKDIPKLAALRARLRSQMSASPLMDKAAFARNVESAYRQMWRAWCEAETV
jgi:predicted O-linked N-acetylglucosamine transferase (SPINDLY family)